MKKKRVAAVLIVVGLILVVVSPFFIFELLDLNPQYEIYFAASGSMEPTFFRGDSLKVDTNVSGDKIYAATKDANPPGDIIVFSRYNEAIVHRAVEKTIDSDGTYSFKTWGDNNGWPDGTPVKESDIIGKVIEINPPLWENNQLLGCCLLATGVIFTVIGIIVIILTHARRPKKGSNPLEVLQLRFAKGEISKAEYEEMKQVLEGEKS